MLTSTSNSGHNKQLTVNSTVNEVTIYTFFRQEGRLEHYIKKSKQTDRQTDKQTLQLIPKHHSNAHNIKQLKIT